MFFCLPSSISLKDSEHKQDLFEVVNRQQYVQSQESVLSVIREWVKRRTITVNHTAIISGDNQAQYTSFLLGMDV